MSLIKNLDRGLLGSNMALVETADVRELWGEKIFFPVRKLLRVASTQKTPTKGGGYLMEATAVHDGERCWTVRYDERRGVYARTVTVEVTVRDGHSYKEEMELVSDLPPLVDPKDGGPPATVHYDADQGCYVPGE